MAGLGCGFVLAQNADDASAPHLRAAWEKNYLTVSGDHLPGPIRINYLEAYCRPGSTDRDWGETVIRHQAELASASDDGRVIRLRDKLADGVVVEHTITVGADEIDFDIAAHNPTDKTSEAHWAQPCIRVDEFTGCGKEDARTLVPDYARKCFLFIDGELARLPTEPWATEARYTPGQVYCPKPVDRDDVNPRPLSTLVPSNGLCGCFSADDRLIMAVAFEPYQEIFQGVIACIHNDFRIGGLAPGETKKIRGKLYIVKNEMDPLLERFRRDFPEQAK
ncbi:MAG: hypothetical protein KY475_07485 [Planctomycetes bacterium]|nr:hypothetical protein [Planctomycetota bacterium]